MAYISSVQPPSDERRLVEARTTCWFEPGSSLRTEAQPVPTSVTRGAIMMPVTQNTPAGRKTSPPPLAETVSIARWIAAVLSRAGRSRVPGTAPKLVTPRRGSGLSGAARSAAAALPAT